MVDSSEIKIEVDEIDAIYKESAIRIIKSLNSNDSIAVKTKKI